MASTKWGKFFWSDWSNDPKLKLCSLAARGLWMQMLCIASESEPTGFVAIGKIPLGAAEISRIAGADKSEVETLIAELERNGVFSRTARGTIFSRRMVSDEKKARIARENGKNGGNPSLRNKRDFSASDKPLPTTPLVKPESRSQNPEIEANPKGLTRLKHSTDPQRADRRSVEPELPIGPKAPVSPQPRKARGADSEPEGFAGFYDAYGYKVGRKDAARAWAAVIKKTSPAVIMAAVAPFQAANPDRRYWPHPATWLNGARWADEHAGCTPPQGQPADAAEKWRPMLEAFKASGIWVWDSVSPAPGSTGCKIPTEILRQFGFSTLTAPPAGSRLILIHNAS